MITRESIQSDLDYMAEHTMSRGVQKSCPEQISYMYTLEDDGVPLGMGGFRLINKYTSWCWVDFSPVGHKNVILSYRTIKEKINEFCKEHKIKRLQAYVECDFPEAIRLAEHLGFSQESTMSNFAGNRDAYMYVRII